MTMADAPDDPASLYEQDFAAWLDAQVAALREGRFTDLDLDNLIEEVESIRRAETRSVEHHARVVIAQLLQLGHSTLRQELEARLQKVYTRGRDIAASVLETEGTDQKWLPRTCPYTLAEILEEGWFPTNVYGFDRFET
jgi:hypothetical protein